MKHFKLTEEKKVVYGATVYRIEATKDSYHAKKGEKGGFVESEDNLRDRAWVENEAVAMNNSLVRDRALVKDMSVVKDDVILMDYAIVQDNSQVKDRSILKDRCIVMDNVIVKGYSVVGHDWKIGGNTIVNEL